ncbi:MAG: GDP-fucose synthetase [Candidatus Marinimicrobia bacterium]|nr:GDP-fucose synthetase [Candidatus Neomarinimicrobiota bacterium]
MNKQSKIFVAGHKGMVGSALVKTLEKNKYYHLITKTSKELDLTIQKDVFEFIISEKPDIVFIAAAKVGGIQANNTYRAEFIYKNLMIQSNIIHASHLAGVKKLLFLGSSCIYPKFAPQPLKEDVLLTGKLEYTNEPYAIAKIAGIKMCENYYRQYGDNFISVMPTNLYGPNDNYDLENSHVLPALIRKIYEAKTTGAASVDIWGTGTPLREFLYVDDLAQACLFVMEMVEAPHLYDSLGLTHLNIGSGEEITIRELAKLIKKLSGYKGKLLFNKSKPDGTPRKIMDESNLKKLGWTYSTSLEEGIRQTILDYESKPLDSL